jgi:hypothetical protein
VLLLACLASLPALALWAHSAGRDDLASLWHRDWLAELRLRSGTSGTAAPWESPAGTGEYAAPLAPLSGIAPQGSAALAAAGQLHPAGPVVGVQISTTPGPSNVPAGPAAPPVRLRVPPFWLAAGDEPAELAIGQDRIERLPMPAAKQIDPHVQPAAHRPAETPGRSSRAIQPGTNRFDALQQRLKQLGAIYYRLESWGQHGEMFRFECKMGLDSNPQYSRYFEAIEHDPARAIEHVLDDVEAWLADR